MTSFHYALSETEVCQAIVQLAVTFLRSGALTPSTVVRPMGLKVKHHSRAGNASAGLCTATIAKPGEA